MAFANQSVRSATQTQSRVRVSAQASATGGKKEKDECSIELQFARFLKGNPDYAQEKGILFRWIGSHFEPLDNRACNTIALDWLEAKAPSLANEARAISCVKTALLKVRPLPKYHGTVVPFRNAYLLIDDQGKIRRELPSIQYGITGVIDVNLPGSGTTYTPGPVPAGSLLENYLTTSLPDREVLAYLQELAGDSLSPRIRFEKATLLKGKGRNGKSIFLRLIQSLHCRRAAMQLEKIGRFDLTNLVGATLVTVDELPTGKFDDVQFKKIVSGSEIPIDRKNVDVINYSPIAKWFISTNHEVKGSDTSEGFWRRFAIIPFDQEIPESKIIPELDRKIIQAEMIHFVDWCLEGLCRLNQRGQLPPTPVTVAMARMVAEECANPLVAWIRDRNVSKVASPTTLKSTIYEDYRQWCEANSTAPDHPNRFWQKLRSKFGNLDEAQSRQYDRCRLINLDIGILSSGSLPLGRDRFNAN